MNNDIVFVISSLIVILCSAVYLIAYRRYRKPQPSNEGECPGVSLIVPMWNEEKTIHETLDSLLAMKESYPGELEILVIDDRSSDNSWKIVSEYTQRHPFVRLLMKEGNQGKSESLNQGIRLAAYDIVGCVDADSYPVPDALTWAVKEFNYPKVGAVTSMLVVNKPKSIIEWFQQVEYVFSNFVLLTFEAMDGMFIARGPLSLFRKDVMQKIGGFLPSNITPTEDMEITFRIRKAGYTLRCATRAKVYTTVMPTWKHLFWQRIRWNRGAIVNFWIHRDMFFNPYYRMFGMFVLPMSIVMIVTGVTTFFHSIYMIISSVAVHNELAEVMINEGIKTAAVMLPDMLISSYQVPPVFSSVLSIVMLSFFLLVNGLGLRESREKINLRYILAMIGTPIFYGPVLVFFWVSALSMQAGRQTSRWR